MIFVIHGYFRASMATSCSKLSLPKNLAIPKPNAYLGVSYSTKKPSEWNFEPSTLDEAHTNQTERHGNRDQ